MPRSNVLSLQQKLIEPLCELLHYSKQHWQILLSVSIQPFFSIFLLILDQTDVFSQEENELAHKLLGEYVLGLLIYGIAIAISDMIVYQDNIAVIADIKHIKEIIVDKHALKIVINAIRRHDEIQTHDEFIQYVNQQLQQRSAPCDESEAAILTNGRDENTLSSDLRELVAPLLRNSRRPINQIKNRTIALVALFTLSTLSYAAHLLLFFYPPATQQSLFKGLSSTLYALSIFSAIMMILISAYSKVAINTLTKHTSFVHGNLIRYLSEAFGKLVSTQDPESILQSRRTKPGGVGRGIYRLDALLFSKPVLHYGHSTDVDKKRSQLLFRDETLRLTKSQGRLGFGSSPIGDRSSVFFSPQNQQQIRKPHAVHPSDSTEGQETRPSSA